MAVIHIRFHEDLKSNPLNKMRFNMEMAAWKTKWRKAEEEKDYNEMDRLDRWYDMIGMP